MAHLPIWNSNNNWAFIACLLFCCFSLALYWSAKFGVYVFIQITTGPCLSVVFYLLPLTTSFVWTVSTEISVRHFQLYNVQCLYIHVWTVDTGCMLEPLTQQNIVATNAIEHIPTHTLLSLVISEMSTKSLNESIEDIQTKQAQNWETLSHGSSVSRLNKIQTICWELHIFGDPEIIYSVCKEEI